MAEENKLWFSGEIVRINDRPVHYRANVRFNKYYQAVAKIFGVAGVDANEIRKHEYCNIALATDDGGYMNLFNAFVKKEECLLPKEALQTNNTIIKLCATITIKSDRIISPDVTFNCFQIEITDGHELIGQCPYDINASYTNIMRFRDISIPVHTTPIIAETRIGQLSFSVYPATVFGTEDLSLGFGHQIRVKLDQRVQLKELHDVFDKITGFFSLLCGEIVTCNRALIVEETEENALITHELLGCCNFPHQRLRRLQGNGFDSSAYLRKSVFKASDIPNVGHAFDVWFESLAKPDFELAHGSYVRIMLDEDVGSVTANKFLAAMQLMEGYISAFQINDNDKEKLEEKKRRILQGIENDEDREFVNQNLILSGLTFRKVTKSFLFESIKVFVTMSRSQFDKKYDCLIDDIVNDRDLYTHSAKDLSHKLNNVKMNEISTIIKNFYRANMMKQFGLPTELIKRRFSHDRTFVAYMKDVFCIEFETDLLLDGFDKEMWHFSELHTEQD